MSDQERFETLVRSVAEPLRRYVMRRVDHDLADEVVADALLVMWRRLDDVPAENPLPWCFGVTRLCLNNALRTRRRQQNLVVRIARLDPPLVQPTDAEPVADAELHAALNRLSEDDRELLRLWAWESLTPSEIAVVLAVSANAVSIRLHRARKRLATQMGSAERKISSARGHEELHERKAP